MCLSLGRSCVQVSDDLIWTGGSPLTTSAIAVRLTFQEPTHSCVLFRDLKTIRVKTNLKAHFECSPEMIVMMIVLANTFSTLQAVKSSGLALILGR